MAPESNLVRGGVEGTLHIGKTVDMNRVSICMVSLNSWTVLQNCLLSILATMRAEDYEVILVDNASTDGTPDNVAKAFPDVTLIRNRSNVGFTRATNQAIERSTGEYLLWLNTDTIVKPEALYRLRAFLETHPTAGIVGPKVLNGDGSFQAQCRRGRPTPLVSLSYMSGLDRIWPHSRYAGQYLLTHLPVDSDCQVESVSGCCLMARRQVWEAIGPLDQAIFGFGEDMDWCVRAKHAGWEVWYTPVGEIIHLKGQGGVHAKPYHKAWGIHQAMWVFYRKHLAVEYPLPVTWAVWSGIWAHFVVSVVGVWLRSTRNRGDRNRPAARNVALDAESTDQLDSKIQAVP
jgi:hypothetical protein